MALAPAAQAVHTALRGPLTPMLERDLGGGHVGDHHRGEERAHAPRASLQQHSRLLLEGPQPAAAARHDGADAHRPQRLRPAAHRPPPGGRLRPRTASTGPCGARRVCSMKSSGSKPLTSPAMRERQARGVELRDRGDAALAGQKPAPGGLDIVAERADDAHPGDDHAPRPVMHERPPSVLPLRGRWVMSSTPCRSRRPARRLHAQDGSRRIAALRSALPGAAPRGVARASPSVLATSPTSLPPCACILRHRPHLPCVS